MFNRFTKEARHLVERAEDEAGSAGSSTIEAEHLLLAYAASEPDTALSSAGITHDVLAEALQSDYEASLRAVGVSDETLDAVPAARPVRRVRLGASFKAALERAVAEATSAGERKIGPRYIAVGALAAKRGTVPRALRSAGFDPEELRARIVS